VSFALLPGATKVIEKPGFWWDNGGEYNMKMESFEPKKEEEPQAPEISVRQERGLELIAGLDDEEKQHLMDLSSQDDEILHWFSLTYQHPERTDVIQEQIEKYKSHVPETGQLQDEVHKVLEQRDRAEGETPRPDEQIEKWEGLREEVQGRLVKDLSFFRAESSKRVVLVPADNLIKKDEGRSFDLGDELVIMSHTENLDNLEHEFLHSIINPSVERAMDQLSEDEIAKINSLAGPKLKQDYGEFPMSLLNEELIRTYNDYYKKGVTPRSLEEFKQNLTEMEEEQFAEDSKNNASLRKRLESLGVESLADLQQKADEYYEAYEKDEFRDRSYEFIKKYEASAEEDEDLTFDSYLSENISELIK
jgi:hypothetical protein